MPDRAEMADHTLLSGLSSGTPVLIAGPTASGKSALALRIAEERGGVIVNADALQVYECWRILTARPSPQDEARVPHALYGHIGATQTYSTGHWLREVAQLLGTAQRPIIVGGTGLYFAALTQGLAEIPATPEAVRAQGDALSRAALVAELDARTAAGIDTLNRARVQRAWEVLQATGRGLADWQADTAAPLLAPAACRRIVFDLPKPVLDHRIARRFDQMLELGVLDEVAQMRDSYDSTLPAHRAIGAPELMRHLRGEITLDAAREAAVIASRQYAKRQRTWMRSRMADWTPYTPPE